VYELFQEALQDPYGPKLLIRAEQTRHRKVEQQDLWQTLKAKPVAGWLEVAVPRRASRPARTAKLQIRFAQVVLRAPTTSKLAPVRIWAVYAREVGYSAKVKEPIDWMLLTTVKTESFKEACERLTWYSRRWGIEVYHRTVKSGCRIEDRRLDDADSLESCLAIDLVVAWRIYGLTMVGREKPEIPCDQFLSEEQWRVLGVWATGQMPDPPKHTTGDALDQQGRRLAGPRQRRQSRYDLHVARPGSSGTHGSREYVGFASSQYQRRPMTPSLKSGLQPGQSRGFT